MTNTISKENSAAKITVPKCADVAICMVPEFITTANRGTFGPMADDAAKKLQSAINRACATCRGYEI